MRDAVITAAVRTPIGKRNGGLKGVHAVDLSALVLREVAARAGIDPSIVDDVHWGNVISIGQQSGNIARMAVLAAGCPRRFRVSRSIGSAVPRSRRSRPPPQRSSPDKPTWSLPAGSR
jgi:acetyl-CoA acyltransferase